LSCAAGEAQKGAGTEPLTATLFVYDAEKDFFRFPDGRFAFSREWADVDLLQERGYA